MRVCVASRSQCRVKCLLAEAGLTCDCEVRLVREKQINTLGVLTSFNPQLALEEHHHPALCEATDFHQYLFGDVQNKMIYQRFKLVQGCSPGPPNQIPPPPHTHTHTAFFLALSFLLMLLRNH